MKRILITGSRDWQRDDLIAFRLGEAVGELLRDGTPFSEVVLVSGACPTGADKMAETIAGRYGMAVERHPAQWRPYGIYNPQAGRYRNQVMVDLGADVCLAFIRNNSSGASHCAQAAEDAGIPVRIYRD